MIRVLDFLRQRKRAYQLTFGSPAGQVVLEDLAKFCRANETCFHADPRLHAVAEGRREVWLRIQQHLNLTADQLAQLYAGPNLASLAKDHGNE
jgi:hypothetical protein